MPLPLHATSHLHRTGRRCPCVPLITTLFAYIGPVVETLLHDRSCAHKQRRLELYSLPIRLDNAFHPNTTRAAHLRSARQGSRSRMAPAPPPLLWSVGTSL